MKFINRARQSGKTTSLIYASYATGEPIIAQDVIRVRNILKQAKALGLDIKAYTIEEYVREVYVYKNKDICKRGVFIDEAEDIISTALQQMLKAPVIACTFTIPCQDIEKKEAADNE